MQIKLGGGSTTLINMSFYQGKELSINAGIDLAIGDFVYEFDSTIMDYPLETIFNIYKKSLEGYDIVSASSKEKRKLSSKIFYKIFNHFSYSQNKIDTESFRIVSRRAINRMNALNKTIPYRKAIQASCGLNIATIYYDVKIRKNDKMDRMLRKEREKNAIDALILFTDVSYKASFILTLLMFLLTFIAFIYTVFVFVTGKPVEGWTTTMLFLSFGFSGIFLIFAIIIKYLSIILNLIFKRTSYLIESINKLN